MLKKIIFSIFLLVTLTCCGTPNISTIVSPTYIISTQKPICIDPPIDDKFNLEPVVVTELESLGFIVKRNSENCDLIAKFVYDYNWDIKDYVENFVIQIIDAKSKQILMKASFHDTYFHHWYVEEAVQKTFFELRKQIKSH